jgi:hypothetical protein
MRSLSFVTPRRRSGRCFAALLVSAVVSVAVAVPASADVSFINAKRSGAGLAPVSSHSGLASLAHQHSADMAARGALFHTGNLAASVNSVLTGWQAVGENVGVGTSLDAVNASLMASSAHRANILGSFDTAGVGVVTGSDGRVWVTQVFARVGAVRTPAPAPAPTAKTASAPSPVAPRPTAPRVSRSAPRSAPAVPAAPVEARQPPAVAGVASLQGGYRIVAKDGGVFTFGDAVFAGSAADLDLAEDVVGGASSPSGNGYVLFGDAGGVFTFGDAVFHGSAAGLGVNAPIVGGAVTPSGDGYHLFAADGGVLTFGDAVFAGSSVGQPLNAPIVGGVRTSTGRGYWLAGADGGVYAFGDAAYFGSPAELGALSARIVSITASRSGRGYWLVAADGGVFAFGDAGYFGSAAAEPQPAPIRSLVVAPGGMGYWLVRADREALPYGDVTGPIRHYFGIASLQIV